MTCEHCGALIDIGTWPFCPHGRGTYAAIADDIPGGLTIENLGPEPVTVHSWSERRRIMKARGLRECIHDLPGASWNVVCEQTLANGRDLVAGDRRARRQHPDTGVAAAEIETLEMTVRELASGFRVKPNGEPYGGEDS